MKEKLKTLKIESSLEIQSFFDSLANGYVEQHGRADKLLQYRLELLYEMADFKSTDTVLDLGCGNGKHLEALSTKFEFGIGIDFAKEMIRVANDQKSRNNLDFRQDDATKLASIDDFSIDVVICTGAFEHMHNQRVVIQQIHRVLREGGRLVILTVNGEYIWYKRIAPLLSMNTRHLSSDYFFNKQELRSLISAEGFINVNIKPWTFIPKGDIPGSVSSGLTVLDRLAKWFGVEHWRGGLQLRALYSELNESEWRQ